MIVDDLQEIDFEGAFRSFGSEDQLYGFIAEVYRDLQLQALNDPRINRVPESDMFHFSYETAERRIWIIGTSYLDSAPVDLMHYSIIPQITEDPSSWLILNQYAGNEDEPREDPVQFYVRKVADIFEIEYEEALPKPDSLEVVLYASDRMQLSEDDIYRLLVTNFIKTHMHEIENGGNFKEVLDLLAESMGKPVGYVTRLADLGPFGNAETEAAFLSAYTDYSREAFRVLLDAYPDKTNILVRVERPYLGAFILDQN